MLLQILFFKKKKTILLERGNQYLQPVCIEYLK